MFINNLKLVLRKLRREKPFTAVNVLGLTVGLTAFLLIALYVQDEFSFDEFHEDKDNIYRVLSEHKEWGVGATVASDFVEYFAKESPQVKSYVRLSRKRFMTLVGHEDKQLNVEEVLFTDPNFFNFFSFGLLEGDKEQAFLGNKHAVITESLKNRLFGDGEALGEMITLEKSDRYIVSAVAEDPPQNSTLQFELLLYSANAFTNNFKQRAIVSNASTFISATPDHSIEQIVSTINESRVKPDYRDFLSDSDFKLLPLSDLRLNAPYLSDSFPKNDMRYVVLFSSIAVVVLLMAIINYVNLTTAQSLKRAKEIGLKKIVGADKAQLVYHQLTESTFFTVLSFLLAFAAAERCIPLLNEVLDKDIKLNYFSFDFFFWVLIVGVIIGAVSGIYPAYLAIKVNPLSLLTKGGTGQSSSSLLRKSLVLFQFVSSAILITVLVIMSSQMNYLQQKDLGFKVDGLISIPLNRDSVHLLGKFKNSVLNVPGVKSASLTNFRIGGATSIAVAFEPNDGIRDVETLRLNAFFADQGFLETLGVGLVWKSDRLMSESFDSDQIVVNTTFAEERGWLTDPNKVRLYERGDKIGKEVVGIVDDIHFRSLKQEVSPMVIKPLTARDTRNLLVRLEPTTISSTIKKLSESYEESFDRPFNYQFVNESVAAFYKKERGQFRLFQAYSSLAIFISVLGLVALTLYMIEQRRREVSIRKVLGASLRQLVVMLNKEYALLILLAFIIASPIAYYAMEDWLSAFKYRVTIHPLLFTVAFLGFLMISWLATLGQSLKVSTENPADTLRNE